jgi:HK97 family phage prohead protease
MYSDYRDDPLPTDDEIRALLRDPELRAAIRENRRLLGATKASNGTVHKALTGSITFTGEGRQIRAVISDQSIDRVGEQVMQKGIQLRNYLANNIVLFNHDPALPSGTASNIILDPNGSTALITIPTGIPRIDELWQLLQARILNSTSIGFNPLEMEPMNPAQPRGPQRYLRSELCEISIVSIPANVGATVLDVSNAKGYGRSFSDPERAARMLRAAELVAKGERVARAWELARKAWPTAAERAASSPHPVDTMTPQQRRAYASARVAGQSPPNPTGNLPAAELEAVARAKHAAGVYAQRQGTHPDRASRILIAAKAARGPRGS